MSFIIALDNIPVAFVVSADTEQEAKDIIEKIFSGTEIQKLRCSGYSSVEIEGDVSINANVVA